MSMAVLQKALFMDTVISYKYACITKYPSYFDFLKHEKV